MKRVPVSWTFDPDCSCKGGFITTEDENPVRTICLCVEVAADDCDHLMSEPVLEWCKECGAIKGAHSCTWRRPGTTKTTPLPNKFFTVEYTCDSNGVWTATIDKSQGVSCVTQGASLEEARVRIRDALALYLADAEAARAAVLKEQVRT